MDSPIRAPLTIPEIVTLVNHDQLIATFVGQIPDHSADREYFAAKTVLLPVIFPHRNQVLRTDNEHPHSVVVLEDPGKGSRHERLAQPDDIPDENAVSLVDVVGGDADGSLLELKEAVFELARDVEFREPGSGLLGKVIRHLDIDMIWWDQIFSRPAFLDDVNEFIGDIDTEGVVPAILEPSGKLAGRVMVENVDIELALSCEPGHGQVATAKIADNGIDGIRPKEQVELRVERVPQEQLDDNLLLAQSMGEFPQSGFIVVVRGAKEKLTAKLLCHTLLQTDGRLVVNAGITIQQTEGIPQFFRGGTLHSDEQATCTVGLGPMLDMLIEPLPSAEIEVPNTEIGPVRELQRVLERRQQRQINVVENLRHGLSASTHFSHATSPSRHVATRSGIHGLQSAPLITTALRYEYHNTPSATREHTEETVWQRQEARRARQLSSRRSYRQNGDHAPQQLS